MQYSPKIGQTSDTSFLSQVRTTERLMAPWRVGQWMEHMYLPGKVQDEWCLLPSWLDLSSKLNIDMCISYVYIIIYILYIYIYIVMICFSDLLEGYIRLAVVSSLAKLFQNCTCVCIYICTIYISRASIAFICNVSVNQAQVNVPLDVW